MTETAAIQSRLRLEHKYILGPSDYRRLRSALAPYVKRDAHTAQAPDGAYLVRTLYFDSSDYLAYRQKTAGEYGRIKVRLRTYADSPQAGPPVRVELKVKWGWAMSKYSTFITFGDYKQFIADRHWPDPSADPVAAEFERLVHVRDLRPKVLVEYRREGFEARTDDPLRVTFDHKVRSTRAASLFPPVTHFRAHRGHAVVFEVKCRDEMPSWLCRVLKQNDLRVVANSKFAQAIETASPDVATPGRYNR